MFASIRVMRVSGVTQMPHTRLCLMPAVRRHNRPAKLERQECDEK